MFLKSLTLALVVTVLFSQAVLATELTSPNGVWVTGEAKARIKLESCGNNLCGTILWLAKPLDPETGAARLDINNPSEALRSRALLGLQILDMQLESDKFWRGTIYNAEDGNIYNSNLRIEGDHLNLQGCVLFGLICKTQTWTRYKE